MIDSFRVELVYFGDEFFGRTSQCLALWRLSSHSGIERAGV